MATHPTVDELEKREEEAFKTGPLSVLTTSVKSNSQASTVCVGTDGDGISRRLCVIVCRCSSTVETTASFWDASKLLTGTAT